MSILHLEVLHKLAVNVLFSGGMDQYHQCMLTQKGVHAVWSPSIVEKILGHRTDQRAYGKTGKDPFLGLQSFRVGRDL